MIPRMPSHCRPVLGGRIAGWVPSPLVPLPVLQVRPGVFKDMAGAVLRLPGAGLGGLPGGETSNTQLQVLILQEARELSRHLIFILF